MKKGEKDDIIEVYSITMISLFYTCSISDIRVWIENGIIRRSEGNGGRDTQRNVDTVRTMENAIRIYCLNIRAKSEQHNEKIRNE